MEKKHNRAAQSIPFKLVTDKWKMETGGTFDDLIARAGMKKMSFANYRRGPSAKVKGEDLEKLMRAEPALREYIEGEMPGGQTDRAVPDAAALQKELMEMAKTQKAILTALSGLTDAQKEMRADNLAMLKRLAGL